MGARVSKAHLKATQKNERVEGKYKTKADRDRLVNLAWTAIGTIVSSTLSDLLDDVAEKITDVLSTAVSKVVRTIAPLLASPLSMTTPLPTSPLQKKKHASRKFGKEMGKDISNTDIFCQAREFGTTYVRPPFPGHIVGMFSCHGVEPSPCAEGIVSKINQDRGSFTYPFAGDENQALFCVFDGHGECGEVVSHAVMLEMPKRLAAALQKSDDPPAVFEKVFIVIDEALPQLVGSNACENSGTTGVVVLLRGTHCWVAHVGDSRAVVGSAWSLRSSRLPVNELSHDHKCDDPTERARIIAAGGFVRPRPAPDDAARVYTDAALTRVGLAMSRAFGDYCVKDFGVICKPTIAEFELSDEGSFLVLASDGVCVRDRSVVVRSLSRAMVVVSPLSVLLSVLASSRHVNPTPQFVPRAFPHQVRVPLVAASR